MATRTRDRSRTSPSQIIAGPVAGVTLTISRGAQRFGRHWHDAYSVGLIAQGAQRWRGRRGVVVGSVGQVINTNPGEVHDGEPLGGVERAWIMLGIAPTTMADLTDFPAGDLEISPPVIDDPDLRRALERTFARMLKWHTRGYREASTTLGVEEGLVAVCGRLAAAHAARPLGESVPDVAAVRMRDRLADATELPTLAELAALVDLSRYQALRAFARCYGLPPYAWLLSLRAERARTRIRSGLSLSAAALECGFVDQSHMTRTFARFYGYTPGEWRRAFGGEASAFRPPWGGSRAPSSEGPPSRR